MRYTESDYITSKGLLDAGISNAPTAANNTVVVNEDTDYVFNLTDFGFSDVDGHPFTSVKITTLESSGSLWLDVNANGSFDGGEEVALNDVIAVADITAGKLRFTPAQDANGTNYDSFGFSVNDGLLDSALNYTMTIDVTPVNDAAVLSGGNTLAYTENDGEVVIDALVVLSDIDDTNIESATISITTNYVEGEDYLSFTSVGGIVGSFNGSTGVLTLTGTASIADYQTALRSVAYQNISDNPDVTSRVIAFKVNDGDIDSNIITSQVDITAVNDAPIFTLVTSQK